MENITMNDGIVPVGKYAQLRDGEWVKILVIKGDTATVKYSYDSQQDIPSNAIPNIRSYDGRCHGLTKALWGDRNTPVLIDSIDDMWASVVFFDGEVSNVRVEELMPYYKKRTMNKLKQRSRIISSAILVLILLFIPVTSHYDGYDVSLLKTTHYHKYPNNDLSPRGIDEFSFAPQLIFNNDLSVQPFFESSLEVVFNRGEAVDVILHRTVNFYWKIWLCLFFAVLLFNIYTWRALIVKIHHAGAAASET